LLLVHAFGVREDVISNERSVALFRSSPHVDGGFGSDFLKTKT
jgi:hypothetical protein